MAATSTVNKLSVNLLLNNGTDASGNTKTVSVSLGALNKDAFDADKVMAVAGLLSPCFEKSLHSVQKVEVSTLTNN